MSALYIMRYLGATGVGFGSVYIGKGSIVGVDTGGGRYHGTYTEDAERMKAAINLTMPDGGVLVTGAQIPPGTSIPMSADWSTSFADGSPQSVNVAGGDVQVTFEKVGDVP